jgi:hypothetical protein
MPSSRHQVIPIAPAAFDNGRPVGLFYRLKVNLVSGAGLELRTLLFLADNRISRTFPYGGGQSFDQSQCNADMCGDFTHEGDQITVRWDNDRVDQWQYRNTGESFELDGDTYRPARGLVQGVLTGTWAGAASTGSASNVYEFGADGTFSFGTGGGGVRGRYSIEGLTLSLAFADGTQSQRTLFAAGSSEPIGLIAVEGEVYRRQ